MALRTLAGTTLAGVGEVPELSLAEWIVLALIAEQPRHGFAVAALTAPDAAVGRAWQLPRPIVYRALGSLAEAGLVQLAGTEQGARGPQRSVYAASPAGAVAVRRWLRIPVERVRDTRSELLVKLALLDRRGWSARPLATAQRKVFGRREAQLLALLDGESDFGRILVAWRLESARAALRFLDTVEST